MRNVSGRLSNGSTLNGAGAAGSLLARCARLQLQAEAALQINRSICNVQDLDQLLMLIAERCRDLLQCDVAGFALVQDGKSNFAWRAWSGCRTDYRDVVFPKRGGIAGRAMSLRRPIVVADLRKLKSAAAEFPISFAEGLRSVLGVPLQIMNAPSGCLMIGYRAVHAFTAEEVDALTSFAAQAAIAVENARLYESLRGERARLESVVQSINEGLVLVGLDDRVVYMNHQATTLLRLAEGECVGDSVQAFIGRVARESTDRPGALVAMLELDRTATGFPTLDIEFGGSPAVTLRLTRFVVYDSVGACLGRGYLCRDVTFEKQVDEMKSEVISLVSHELRTPLALIRGYSSALLDGSKARSEALRKEYLQTIDTESLRLAELVRKLTDISKLDQGVFELDVHDVDAVALLTAVISRWRKAVPEREFVSKLPSRRAIVRADRKCIEQVLDNLLSNAVRYSRKETPITLTLQEHAESIVFSVHNRGRGIPAAERQRVFERFYRVRGSKNGEGSGLGLYIARGIVNAHGGRIWLDSHATKGTTVLFSIPRAGRKD